jgi:hypothetical protein
MQLKKSALSLFLLTSLSACGGGSDAPKPAPEVSRYTVTVEHNSGGTVSPTTASVESGNTATFEISPDEGYSVSSASGCNGSLTNLSYTTGAISQACTVQVAFAESVVSATLAVSDDVAALKNISVSSNYPSDTLQVDYDENGLSIAVKESRFIEGFEEALIVVISGQLDDDRAMQYALMLSPDDLLKLEEPDDLSSMRIDAASTAFAAYAVSYTEMDSPTREALAEFEQVFVPDAVLRRGQLLSLYQSGERASAFGEDISIYAVLSSNLAYREAFHAAIQGRPNFDVPAQTAEQQLYEVFDQNAGIELPYGEYFEFTNDASGDLTQLYANYSTSSITASVGPVAEAELNYTLADGEIAVEQDATTRPMSTALSLCVHDTKALTSEQLFIDAAYSASRYTLSVPCERTVVALKPLRKIGDAYLTLVTTSDYVSPTSFFFMGYGNFTTDEVVIEKQSLRLLSQVDSASLLTSDSFSITEGSQLVLPIVDFSQIYSYGGGSDLAEFSTTTEASGSYLTSAADAGVDIPTLVEYEKSGTWTLNESKTELTLRLDDQPDVNVKVQRAMVHGSEYALLNEASVSGYVGYRFLSYGGPIDQPTPPEQIVGLNDNTDPEMLVLALDPRFDSQLERFYENSYVYPYSFLANGTGSYGFSDFGCDPQTFYSENPHEHLPTDCSATVRVEPRFNWDFSNDTIRRFNGGWNGNPMDCTSSFCSVELFRLLELTAEGSALVYRDKQDFQIRMQDGEPTIVALPSGPSSILRMRVVAQ